MSKLFSENAQAVLVHLQANQGVDETGPMIAEATGIPSRSITGVVNSLCKKGFCERPEGVEIDGKKVIRLTPAGAAVDPDADKPED